jgi:hypothetical protein
MHTFVYVLAAIGAVVVVAVVVIATLFIKQINENGWET